MRSFHNDSQSIIKSTDETHINIKQKNKNEKNGILPDIKVNIIYNENEKFKNNDSDFSDDENNKRNMMTYMKLPQIFGKDTNKNKNADSNYFNSNEYKNQMKHNLSNQSLGIQFKFI